MTTITAWRRRASGVCNGTVAPTDRDREGDDRKRGEARMAEHDACARTQVLEQLVHGPSRG